MERLNKTIVEGYESYPEKVLQFGEGNFIRAFVDWQIEIMNQTADFNGSVVIVQPRGYEKIEKLNLQDGLYTVYLQGKKECQDVNQHTLIHSISRGLNLFSQYDEFVQLAKNPSLRFIFSNTTEAGIAFDESDRLEDRPQKSYPGKLAAFLYYRFKALGDDKNSGFIIIPCELVENSGEKLKEFVLKFADLWDLGEGFVQWVQEANTFCSSLVDRIVSGFPEETSEEMTKELGYQDEFLVVGEPFHLWVIEGPQWIREEFPAHMAGLNTLFVDDLTPYRTRKVRILNGAHTAMTPVSYLYGLNTVGESVKHPVIGRFIKELIFEEILPTLDLPTDELTYFANAALERFSNPFIKHYLLSISLNSISKYKTRNLPSLLEYFNRTKTLPDKLVFSLAALISFYQGKRGEEIIPFDDEPECLELFKSIWNNFDGTLEKTKELVQAVLSSEKMWGMNLNRVPDLTERVTRYLYDIETKGIKKTVEAVLKINSEC